MKVMVTGATEGFGLLLTKRLSNISEISQIVALKSSEIDYDDEEQHNQKLELATAKNLRPRALEDVFKKNPDIDVVVHLAYSDKPQRNENGKFIHETNVFGTMRLLDLCEKYGVKKFIHKSPSSIYGANPDNPVLIKEDFPLRGNRSYQALRDKIEADILCQMHMRADKKPKIVIFRFCGIIGDNIRSPLNTLFQLPFVPTILGFDPMFQIIHEDDVINAITSAILNKEAEGVFNVAGKHTEPLSHVIRRMERIPVPTSGLALELLYKPVFMLKREHTFPFDISYWKFPFAVDTTRAKEILGFEAKVL